MNLFISQENYKILFKEKYKIFIIIGIYLLILFSIIYAIYLKSNYSTKIFIVDKPNISLIHNYNNIYKKLKLFPKDTNFFFYDVFYENFHSEVVNNKSIIDRSLNLLKLKYNFDFENDKISNNIFIDLKTIKLIGPKRIFEGKKYIEISITREIFNKLKFYDKKIYKYFLSEIIFETNRIIFSKFNDSVNNYINLRALEKDTRYQHKKKVIDIKDLENKIKELKIKINNEIDIKIKNFNVELKNLIKKYGEVVTVQNMNLTIPISELNTIIENLIQKNQVSTNDNISPLIQLLLYIDKNSNDKNSNDKNFIKTISAMNFFYPYFLLEELKNIEKFTDDDDYLNDISLIDEDFKDIINNIKNNYIHNIQIQSFGVFYTPSYTVYRNAELIKIIQLNQKIISLNNNLKPIIIKKNLECSSDCYLKYTINSTNHDFFTLELTNFYIITIFILSIFFLFLYLTLYLLLIVNKYRF